MVGQFLGQLAVSWEPLFLEMAQLGGMPMLSEGAIRNYKGQS